MGVSASPSPRDGPQYSLDSVTITDELSRRTPRAPDFEAENRALSMLMDAMALGGSNGGFDRILQKLSDAALDLCHANSAGVSLLESHEGEEVFRWRGAAGAWKQYLGGSIPTANSPCSAVIKRDAAMLMAYPERHHRYAEGAPSVVEALVIPFHFEGKPIGTVWIVAHDETRRFDAEDQRVITSLARFAAMAYQLLQAHRVKADLDDAELLQRISAELIVQDDVKTLYEKLLDAVVGVMQADFASIQMFHPDSGGGELELLASRGLTAEAEQYWKSVRIDSRSIFGEALELRQRVIAADLDRNPRVLGSMDEAFYEHAGIHASQTTPLLSRTGALLGMISTHWRNVHQPTERDLCVLDILARQAADLIERVHTEEALRDAAHRKDEFLAILAHELRNPLAPMRNAIEILRLGDPRSKEVRWARDVMDRQTAQMSRLIDDLLDVSRLTRDRLELRRERVDLATAIQAAVETSRPFIEEGRHELTITLPGRPIAVEADTTRLAQVFANLLNNAAKYSDARGRISIEARREAGEAVVSVRDHGIGISREVLPRVFGLFSQAESSHQRVRGGLGIGLTLVKRLTEMHGGTVEAMSDGLGKGSEFIVRLPLPVSQRLAAQESAEGLERAPGPRRILVVDDNEDSATSLSRMLDMLGYDTRTANDGLSGFDAAAIFHPEVALLDVGMPRMNGYELARNIRVQPWGKEIVLIAVTGWGQAEDKQRTMDAGFNHHLVKPVDPSTLAKLLARVPSAA